MEHFELLVIGSGPAGQRAAVAASKLGHRAAVVERTPVLGGVSIHTGTIPSKTLREAVIYLTGYHQRTFYGRDYTVDDDITMADLLLRAEHVIRHAELITAEHLLKNGVEVMSGEASFIDARTVAVHEANGPTTIVTADRFLIATGSEAAWVG